MLCIGNSHMACVLAAAEREGVLLKPAVLKDSRYFEGITRKVEVVQPRRLGTWLARADDHGPVFSFIGGTRHLAATFRHHPRPYDVFLPAAPHLPVEGGAEIVPVDALRIALAKRMAPQLRAIEALIDLAHGPVLQFEPPPPPTLHWWDAVARRHSQGSRKDRRYAPYLRYKLWRLNSEIVRGLVVRRGGTFVESPAAARDDEGFLRTEFVANSTHANTAYGTLVLEQLQALA